MIRIFSANAVERTDGCGPEFLFHFAESIAVALTARELEVLLLLDRHLGTDEIATRLFISEHTVRSHVKSAMHRLNAHTRTHAVATALQAAQDRLFVRTG